MIGIRSLGRALTVGVLCVAALPQALAQGYRIDKWNETVRL